MSIESIPKIFGVGWVKHLKEIVFVSDISALVRPETPLGPKEVSCRAKNGQKFFVKLDTKLLKNEIGQ